MDLDLIFRGVMIGQVFLSGVYFGMEPTPRTFWDKVRLYGGSILITLAGVPILILGFLYLLAAGAWSRVSRYFHIWFIVKYIVLRRDLGFNSERYPAVHAELAAREVKWYNLSLKTLKWIDRWVMRNYATKAKENG